MQAYMSFFSASSLAALKDRSCSSMCFNSSSTSFYSKRKYWIYIFGLSIINVFIFEM